MKLMNLANRLEIILRKYLKTHHINFHIKANDSLFDSDWIKPVSFVLGHRYAFADIQKKDDILKFLECEFQGKNIVDLNSNKEKYCLTNEEQVFKYIQETISKIEYLLSDDLLK
ncbi:hypothetical protein UPTC15622_00954 [Campylobacter lari]|uniref:hypothetical protein n=1 Tax=Campylobacter lari TaxID=201 RepID=UPI0021535DA4|nr:hypothetical protein [Campylobacter lari]MCR6566397.1 hypothetical protein [Campylobacter lari]